MTMRSGVTLLGHILGIVNAAGCRVTSRGSLAFWFYALSVPALGPIAQAQELLEPSVYRAIREASSGELPFADFERLAQLPGFAPSPGADQVADYLVNAAKSIGLSGVAVERYSSDGEHYHGAFRGEPSWTVEKAQLWLEAPERQLLSDYDVYKGSLARFSHDASVTAELIDVGTGDRPSDYANRPIAGKIVLASGSIAAVTRLAIWKYQAAGIVFYRTKDAIEFPNLISSLQFVPWQGPKGEEPTFAFSLSYQEGMDLKNRLAAGQRVALHADVKAHTGPGAYPEVTAEIAGSDPTLPAVLVYAHDNSRNTGGANNLTGVGCTLEIARELTALIASGELRRPLRTIRFMWGAEHYGITLHFQEHPEDVARILTMVNIDMIGFSQNQRGAAAVFHLYRSPYSNPSFVDDIVQDVVERVGKDNAISIRNEHFLSSHPSAGFLDPLFAPTGSHDQFFYNIEPFWGPSDHEDAQTFGIRAVFLGDEPDNFIGTQADSPSDAGDATQMRRGVVIGAAAAYYLASMSEQNLPEILQNSIAKAQARLGAEQSMAFSYVNAAGPKELPAAYYEARNLISQWLARESLALAGLSELVGHVSFSAAAGSFLSTLRQTQRAAMDLLEAAAGKRAKQLRVSRVDLNSYSTDSKYRWLPRRDARIRGPVNILRLEYGRWWLIDQTGSEDFESTIRLAQRGEYAYYEALNLANGKRSVSEIRDIISSEFGPIPASEVLEFFEFMQRVGVVQSGR